MHYKYWTIAKAHLGLPTIAQSQSDLATRQGIWGQDSCELLVTAYLFILGVSHPELCLQPARSAAAPSSPPFIKASSVGCSRGDSMLWAGTIGSCHVLCCSCTLPHCSHTLHSSAPPWQLMGWQLRWEGAPAQQQHLSSVYQTPHGCCGLSAVTGYQEQFLQVLLIVYSQGEASVLHSLGCEEWKWFCCVLLCTAWISCILWDTYCRVPWSLQCHSDEHVAQTTWQFPYQFLQR